MFQAQSGPCTSTTKHAAKRPSCGSVARYTRRQAATSTTLTLIVHIQDDGVDFLTTHWGCGHIPMRLSHNIPLTKFKCIWLQVRASQDQAKHIAHIRRNLIDFYSILCHLESLRCLRVDFWDSCHHRTSLPLGPGGATNIQGGIRVITSDVESLVDRWRISKESAERHTWRAVNSTGPPSTLTDIDLVLQPLSLLRNVADCQIYLTPELQKIPSLIDLVANYKRTSQSKVELTMEDLQLVHDTSEDLYWLRWHHFRHLLPTEQERMNHLLRKTERWHSIPVAPQ